MTNRIGPTYVIGTGLSHDGSTCLLADGVVVVAIEKERLTRVKHDGGNDRLAMQYVLDAAGITLSDVSVVVQNENFGMFRGGNTHYEGESRLLSDATRVVTISHHLAHAYSAFGACPFDEAAVLVIDGCGNSYEDCIDVTSGTLLGDVPSGLTHLYFEKDSFYAAGDNALTTVAKDFSPWGAKGWALCPPTTLHSIGGLYHAFSEYVFGGLEDAGKLMGLAPYGRLDRFDEPLFELQDGRVLVRPDGFRGFTTPARTQAEMARRFQYFADVARWVQSEVERALLYLVHDRCARFESPNLAYAGGVALNAVANTQILRNTGVEKLFVQPAAGDNGLALGCAYYGWMQVLGRERVPASGSIQLGRSYSHRRIQRAVEGVQEKVEVTDHGANGGESALVNHAVSLLAEGKVVGWCRGGAEFGPRALGHRSILAHPGLPGLRDHINRRVKLREDFRPFAPSALAERAASIFDCEDRASPYMTFVFGTRPEWQQQLGNVVHADGSARLQTVTAALSPTYHQLIARFEAVVGTPVVLNTSLNKRGMPIVETPEEAIALFLEVELDALVIGDLLVTKVAAIKPISERRVHARSRAPEPEDIPLLGTRIDAVSFTHDLADHPAAGTSAAPATVVLRFTDTPKPLQLTPGAYRFLGHCDGHHSYSDISAILDIPTNHLLEFATKLAKVGVLDHVAQAGDEVPLFPEPSV